MLNWLRKLFGISASAPPCPVGRPSAQTPAPRTASPPDPDPDEHDQESAAEAALPPDGAAFLKELLGVDREPLELHQLSRNDRLFISDNLKNIRLNRVEIPILPTTVAKIQQLVANPEARMDEIAAVFRDDQTLSAELLRLANSSYIACSYPTFNLQQAIARIGFSQLQGLVIMFSFRTRIIQRNRYKDEVTWVTELSLAMAKLCQLLADDLGLPSDEAFTLGLMHHIEHLVIISEACRMTAQLRDAPVSRTAIIEMSHLAGPKLRQMIMKSWGMDSLERYCFAASGADDAVPEPLQSDFARSILERLDRLQLLVIDVMSGTALDISCEGFNTRRLRESLDKVVTVSPSAAGSGDLKPEVSGT